MTDADLIEKRLPQSLHICVIADVGPGFVEARFDPQCGQTGPSGYITDSSHFRALASVENILAIAWTGSAVRFDRPGPPLPTFPDAMSTSRAWTSDLARDPRGLRSVRGWRAHGTRTASRRP